MLPEIQAYYRLAKPGIVYGNSLSAIAGFLLAVNLGYNFSVLVFVFMLLGLGLVMGAACVFNNIYDADIDKKMARTQKRAIPSGQISKINAFIYGLVLLFAGFWALGKYTTVPALVAALAGFVIYVFFYTPLKKASTHATLVGALAGATPPVVGYAALSGRYDIVSAILFLFLVFWQMPHFYAIAIFRLNDYKEAEVPVLSIKRGVDATMRQMLIYIVLYLISAVWFFYSGRAGYFYLFLILLPGLWWFKLGLDGFKNPIKEKWARKMFYLSLIILLVSSFALSTAKWLP